HRQTVGIVSAKQVQVFIECHPNVLACGIIRGYGTSYASHLCLRSIISGVTLCDHHTIVHAFFSIGIDGAFSGLILIGIGSVLVLQSIRGLLCLIQTRLEVIALLLGHGTGTSVLAARVGERRGVVSHVGIHIPGLGVGGMGADVVRVGGEPATEIGGIEAGGSDVGGGAQIAVGQVGEVVATAALPHIPPWVEQHVFLRP